MADNVGAAIFVLTRNEVAPKIEVVCTIQRIREEYGRRRWEIPKVGERLRWRRAELGNGLLPTRMTRQFIESLIR
jgi:hypothetical protein